MCCVYIQQLLGLAYAMLCDDDDIVTLLVIFSLDAMATGDRFPFGV